MLLACYMESHGDFFFLNEIYYCLELRIHPKDMRQFEMYAQSGKACLMITMMFRAQRI